MTVKSQSNDPLAALKISQPTPEAILHPPPPAPMLADEDPFTCSPEVERYVGRYCRWKDESLNAPNRYIFVQNSFMSSKGNDKYLSRENVQDEAAEKFAVSFVLFSVALAEDKHTRIVTEHFFRDSNVAGGTVFIDAKAFIEEAAISVEGNLLGMEAEQHRRAQMGGLKN